ncbi:hypothetical protein BDV96DRAFT_606227 [Lophiotrema nucula]|uniref:Uncharacterized protein n=1 Tax=Lophiotrema nucula TaxID=690887 RepID=A0A6A5YLT5_9PLEO|nr:hypothetical protein BDV96DRAFT_606227 [Lophiotrema nucula]
MRAEQYRRWFVAWRGENLSHDESALQSATCHSERFELSSEPLWSSKMNGRALREVRGAHMDCESSCDWMQVPQRLHALIDLISTVAKVRVQYSECSVDAGYNPGPSYQPQTRLTIDGKDAGGWRPHGGDVHRPSACHAKQSRLVPPLSAVSCHTTVAILG